MRFRPFGAVAFLRVPMHELAGRFERIDSLSPRLSRMIAGRVCGQRSPVARMAALEQVLLAWLQGARQPDVLVQEAVHSIVASQGRVSVAGLTQHLGVHERHLERKFLEFVGLSPKLLCRIIRFQQVFHAVERNVGHWADVALDCGYYDQSHLVKDFRQFAGQSPAALLTEHAALTEAFTRKGRVSGIYKTTE